MDHVITRPQLQPAQEPFLPSRDVCLMPITHIPNHNFYAQCEMLEVWECGSTMAGASSLWVPWLAGLSEPAGAVGSPGRAHHRHTWTHHLLVHTLQAAQQPLRTLLLPALINRRFFLLNVHF